MNPARLLFAIVACFVTVFATDFLIHNVWLANDYAATRSLWRPESAMRAYFPFMIAAQFLVVLGLCLLWAIGFAGRSLGSAILFGLFLGVCQSSWPLALYGVMPLPGSLVAKWVVSGLVQVILVSVVAALICKPRAATR